MFPKTITIDIDIDIVYLRYWFCLYQLLYIAQNEGQTQTAN